MAALEFTHTTEGSVQVVAIAGRLDNLTSPEFDKQIAAVPGNRVLLDLSRLDYISSAGMRSVLGTLKRLFAGGGALALAAPSPAVREVFEISGFVTLVTIYPGRAAGVAALS